MATQVQTVVESLPSRLVIVKRPYRLNLDPSVSPSGDPSSHTKTKTKSKSKDVGCNKIIRILARFKVSKSWKMYDPKDETKVLYKLAAVNKNPVEVFDHVLDGGESALYKKLFLEGKHIIWDASGEVPSNIFLVRCASDKLLLVNTKQAQEAKTAFALFQYETERKKQGAMDRRSNYHFEAKERRALAIVAELGQCKGYQDCQSTMLKACKHPDRHPEILKSIYEFAQKLRLPSHLTWEEICFLDENDQN